MSEIDTVGVPRPVRVTFPVQVTFEGESFQIEEFTANLSVGGIFLPTEREVPPRTRGTLTFRTSQLDRPFTVQAEVVRVAPPGGPSSHPSGLGIMFVDLDHRDRRRLERLVEGIRDGSVTEAIRRQIRDTGDDLPQVLRRRPTDQKLAFALGARGEEIDALVRDGNPSVVLRLLDNPRLTHRNVQSILREPRTPTAVLLALDKSRRWLDNEETLVLFCGHPRAPVERLKPWIGRLPAARIVALERNPLVRVSVRRLARELLAGRRAPV